MTGFEAIEAIRDTLEALAPTTKASEADVFQMAVPDDAGNIPYQNRTFLLVDSGVLLRHPSLPAKRVLSVLVNVWYDVGQDALQKRLEDSELILSAIIGMTGALDAEGARLYPQIDLVEVGAGVVLPHPKEVEVLPYLFTVRYDPRQA